MSLLVNITESLFVVAVVFLARVLISSVPDVVSPAFGAGVYGRPGGAHRAHAHPHGVRWGCAVTARMSVAAMMHGEEVSGRSRRVG